MPQNWPNDWPPDRIAAFAGIAHAAYLEPSEPVRLALLDGTEPLHPRTIIEVGGVFLVESVSEPDDWYMGQRAKDGVIECWGRYGDIESALRAL
jgi:hypothetical protein